MLGGLLAGGAVSFLLLPSVIRFLGIRAGEEGDVPVTLNPAVVLLAVALTAFTIYMGSRKPVKMAVSVSPLEAAGYRPAQGKDGRRRTGRGRLIPRMALDQVLKDKKKSAVIIVSLAAGLSVFLCLSTLLESQAARTIVTNHMNNDITVTNDTLKKEDPEEHRDLLTEDFLRSLEDVSGVSQVYPLIYGQITVPWEPDFADLWMKEFYAKWMNIPYSDEAEEYKEYPENFGSVILGVSEAEFPYLQETVGAELDREEFLSGRSCVLYRNGLDLTMDDLAGKEVTCAEYGNGENTRTFQIAGLTDEGYYSGPMLGYPPTVIVSDAVVRSRKCWICSGAARMLILEGLFFAGGSLILTATAGLAVTYAVYQSMNYMQAPFVVPVWPLVGMAVFITAVCVGIPLAAGARMIRKGSVVERVRLI